MPAAVCSAAVHFKANIHTRAQFDVNIYEFVFFSIGKTLFSILLQIRSCSRTEKKAFVTIHGRLVVNNNSPRMIIRRKRAARGGS